MRRQIISKFKMPISDVKPLNKPNFGLGGVGNEARSLHQNFVPRQPPGITATPGKQMPTIGYNTLDTVRPQSALEASMDAGAQHLREMTFQEKLREMLEFLYKAPRGLMANPLLVPMNVLRHEGLLGQNYNEPQS